MTPARARFVARSGRSEVTGRYDHAGGHRVLIATRSCKQQEKYRDRWLARSPRGRRTRAWPGVAPRTRRGARTAGTERVAADARRSSVALPMRRSRLLIFTISNSSRFFVPAARCCARVLLSSSHPTPIEGRAERRKGALFHLSRCRARRPRLARRGARPAGRARLSGAPPWRFSAGGRASISGIASGSVQRCSSQPGRSAWRAGSRTSRGRRLPAAAAGRHSPLRLRHVSGDALDERGFGLRITDTRRSQ